MVAGILPTTDTILFIYELKFTSFSSISLLCNNLGGGPSLVLAKPLTLSILYIPNDLLLFIILAYLLLPANYLYISNLSKIVIAIYY